MKKLVFIFLALFSFSTVVFAQEEYSPQSRCINKSICLSMTFDEINKSVPEVDRFPTLSALKTEKMRGFDFGIKSYSFDDARIKGSVNLGFLDGVLFKIIVVFNDKNKEVLTLTDEEIQSNFEARKLQSLIKR